MTPRPPALLRSAAAFAALGSEQRLSVLLTLVRAGPDGLSMGELGKRTGLTGATLTHHTKMLAQTGLVEQVRHGRSILCTVAFDQVQELSDFLLAHCCADSAEGHDHG